jgi:hypothetical protein
MDWRGPYIRVQHYKQIYSPEKYRRLREKGLSSLEALRHTRHKARRLRECYLGKAGIRYATRPIPVP